MTRRYNHQFSIVYSVNSDDKTGADVDAKAHRLALIERADELLRLPPDEVRETVENMDDTYENVCPSPDGWPPEPEESEDPATTG